jgi:release factor glutamine methyltransferase
MPKNQTIKTLLSANTAKLKAALIDEDSAFFETSILLQHILKVNRAWLISHENEFLTPENKAIFEALVTKRMTGKPIAYILGEREFYGLRLKVTPDTLIPRPDTETLVDAALEKIPNNRSTTLLDLGTGTGAIALAIAKHRPLAHITAVDASESALKVAQQNAQNLSISNVTFLPSNWFDALPNQVFDMIISNPPYIADHDPHLSQGDLRFEPRSALASGIDGLDDIRQIIDQASSHLKASGWLMLEHGYNQAERIANMLLQAEFIEVQHVQDLAGIQRVTLGQWPIKLGS